MSVVLEIMTLIILHSSNLLKISKNARVLKEIVETNPRFRLGISKIDWMWHEMSANIKEIIEIIKDLEDALNHLRERTESSKGKNPDTRNNE